MSTQHHLQDQAADADPWTLFCAECSQKMKVMRATPAQKGRETRTYECVCGHSERINVAIHGRKPRSQRIRRFPRETKDRP